MSISRIQPNHVALLVKSADHSAKALQGFRFQIGAAEEWDGEGTKEIYIERDKGNSLLLMEPTKPGAYQRAMEKRGPGLHHVAIDVLKIDEFLNMISGSGWLLHPISIQTLAKTKTAYLARPGFPALIEVQEREILLENELFVSRVELTFDQSLSRLLSVVGLDKIIFSSPNPKITVGSRSFLLDSILTPNEFVRS